MINNNSMHPKLESFINEVRIVVEKNNSEEIVTKQVADLISDLLKEKDFLPDEYKKANPEKQSLYPIYVSPDKSFSIVSAVWDVNQSTPIHDHRIWGVLGLLQGEEQQIQYNIPTQGGPPKKNRETILTEGEVEICCTSDQDIHKVTCVSQEPSIGIHVYGGDLGEIERHVYDDKTGEKKSVVTGWDPIPN